MKSNTEQIKPYGKICCGRSYFFKTKSERDRFIKIHEKTFKHKLNQAVADEWVRANEYYNKVIEKIMNGEPYCGRFPKSQ